MMTSAAAASAAFGEMFTLGRFALTFFAGAACAAGGGMVNGASPVAAYGASDATLYGAEGGTLNGASGLKSALGSKG